MNAVHARLLSAGLLTLSLQAAAFGARSTLSDTDKIGKTTKVWVYFTDKGVSGDDAVRSALDAVASTYNPRAIERRRLRREAPGLFDERDLPVYSEYLDQVCATGARVHVVSRWLDAASVYATPAQVKQLSKLGCVDRIERVRSGSRGPSVTNRSGKSEDLQLVAPPPLAQRGPPPIEGEAFEQQAQIGVIAMHDAGFAGQGVIIGVLDTGFKRTHVAFNDPQHPLVIVAEHDFIFNDGNTTDEAADEPGQHNHGTYVLGLMGAYMPGSYSGAAYDAHFILCKTEDIRSETPIEEDNYVGGLEFIESHGGDIATSSLSYSDWYTSSDYDGQTAVTSIAVNVATANGMICLTAQGNAGHDENPTTGTLGAPADAFKVLSVGAVDFAGNSAGFTSDGPTADGRIKPEILARGVDNPIVRAGADEGFTSGSGTSFATPLAAGAVACVLQAHPTWSVTQMRAYLCTSASGFVANHTFDPLFVRGFGILNVSVARQEDCNQNGVNDSAEIAGGLVEDCNSNGVPDSCDIALGLLASFSADADGNARPDECRQPPLCAADWNQDGSVSSQDFFDFLTGFFTDNADFNMSGATDSQDFFDFVAAFFVGC